MYNEIISLIGTIKTIKKSNNKIKRHIFLCDTIIKCVIKTFQINSQVSVKP